LFERVFEITKQKEKLWDWADPSPTFLTWYAGVGCA
jgi:hypothetical protein